MGLKNFSFHLGLTVVFLIVSATALPVGALAKKGFSARTDTSWGLHTATFRTPHGNVKVNLPDDMAAGDTLSGTVVAEPFGENEREWQRNEDELNGYVVEVEKKKTTVSGKILKIAVPVTIAGGVVSLILRDSKGKKLASTMVPVNPTPPAIERPPVPTEDDFHLPTVGQPGRPVEIEGPFDGDFDTTGVEIGGEEVDILAESPRKTVVLSPKDVVGPTTIKLTEGDVTVSGTMHNLRVRLSAPKTKLLRGEETTLGVNVSGLEGITEPVMLNLYNETPEVVNMEGGNAQTISIAPGDVGTEGVYSFERTLLGVQTGSFNILAQVQAGAVAHDYATTKKWKSKGHEFEGSGKWGPRHSLARSVKDKVPDEHEDAKSRSWDKEKHSESKTQKWDSEGHEFERSRKWNGHKYTQSKKWVHTNHDEAVTSRWDRHGHSIRNSKEWRGDGHDYQESRKWERRRPREHSYSTTKKWKGYGHEFEESGKWKAKKHSESKSLKGYEHDEETSKQWGEDRHRQALTRSWRGDEHGYTESRRWKREKHNFNTTKRWNGEGHSYSESSKW
ncbi:MAG: hypothetical protein V3U74_00245 [Thermodesulfobacteriota bacterium]